MLDEDPETFTTFPFAHEFRASTDDSGTGLVAGLKAGLKSFFTPAESTAPSAAPVPAPPTQAESIISDSRRSKPAVSPTRASDVHKQSSAPASRTKDAPQNQPDVEQSVKRTAKSRPSSKVRQGDGYTRPYRMSLSGVSASVRLTPAVSSRVDLASSSPTSVTGRQMPYASGSGWNPRASIGSDSGRLAVLTSPSLSEFPNSQSFNGNFSSIPGFALSRDLLNDDAHSVSSVGVSCHSSSAHRQTGLTYLLRAATISRKAFRSFSAAYEAKD